MNISILGLSFIEGMGLILSPCILPILPLILVTGVQGGKLRPYGIILGFIATFVTFTFFARKIFSIINVDPLLLQQITVYLILAFGVILYSDYLSEKFGTYFQKFANFGQIFSDKANRHLPKGFWSGVLLGSGIAMIWTPCAGPIMAAVLVQTIQQKADTQAFFVMSVFSIGVALPMLIMTIFSKKIIQHVRVLSRYTHVVRKVIASIIIITMLFTKFNVWQKLFDLRGAALATKEFLPATDLIDALENPYPSPHIEGITKWINSEPLSIEELKKQGKVVLIDFWTYSCINCVRTLPYIKNLYERYHDKGLVIIGIHAPEFEFEKNIANVEKAIQDDGIKYPVAMDNNLVTWGNFANRYWPAHYLINKEGQVIYTHFGEGDYDITENNIRYLLGLGKISDFKESSRQLSSPINPEQSPETYLGAQRTEGFASTESMLPNKTQNFTYPKHLALNNWALRGEWTVQGERIIAQKKGSSLKYHFQAKQVYLVMAPSNLKSSSRVRVLFNGKPVKEFAGKDLKNSYLNINKSTLYELVNFKELTSGIIEVQTELEGLEAFAFTFGSK